jgi:hypothetical protein
VSAVHRRSILGVIAAVSLTLGTAACSDADPAESPAPGGTQGPTEASDVRAPNGTNMGAVPANQGTVAP